jgi:two-component system response regulator DevR
MIRVLLVEDHRVFSDGFAFILDKEPDLKVVARMHSVSECQRYLADGEGFDIAIVDLHLPDGEGASLIEEMRESCPDVPVLVLTISSDAEELARAREAGADEVLSKSDDFLDILGEIRRFARS